MKNYFQQRQENNKCFSVTAGLSKGFSLVEILVVVALLVLLSLITVRGFSQYSYRQMYTGFVSEVTDNLTEVRQKTIGSLNDTVYGMYVGTSTIEFFSGDFPVVGSPANTIIEMTSSVTATTSFSTGAWYITFSRLTGEPTATGTLTFFDARTSASTTITIYKSGLIE